LRTPAASLAGADLPGAPDIAAIQNQLVQAKVLQKELYSRFGPKHPEVKSVEEQISSLLVEERKALQVGQELLRRELETVTASEKELSNLCQRELDQTKVLDSFHLEEQQLANQLARVQTVHDSLVTQIRQWKLTDQIMSEGHSPIRISVLEAPAVPRSPVWPSRRILAGLCGALGLMMGFGLIVLLEIQTKKPDRRRRPEHRVAHRPQPAMHGI
jgi:uncharacterized protein involved in exopolysaccharide biosynthesis